MAANMREWINNIINSEKGIYADNDVSRPGTLRQRHT